MIERLHTFEDSRRLLKTTLTYRGGGGGSDTLKKWSCGSGDIHLCVRRLLRSPLLPLPPRVRRQPDPGRHVRHGGESNHEKSASRNLLLMGEKRDTNDW